MIRHPLLNTSLTLIALVLLAGCATSPEVEPDDMSAEEHREAAEQHRQEAVEHEGESAEYISTGSPTDPFWGTELYDPLHEYHQELVSEHLRHAKAHEEAAEALESFEEAECKSFPAETRALCPLLGALESVDTLDTGVTLHFRDGANVDAIEAHVRCHLAFAAVQGYEGMDACPLYLQGLTLERVGDDLQITSSDPDHVEALQTRSLEHVM